VNICGAYPDEGKFMQNRGFFGAQWLQSALFFALALNAGTAGAGESYQWLWSDRAPLINRSTEALASGHGKRAERFALAARASAAHPADQAVILHNLCLARMSTRGPSAAADDCAAAVRSTVRLTPAENRVMLIRGRLLPVTTQAQGETLNLADIVQANVARAYGWRMVDHMRETALPPW